MSRRDRILTAGEWACAAGLSAFMLAVHLENLLHASALRRDEISTLSIAGRPTLADLWSVMEWESSPLLWPHALRALAFLVGVGVVLSLCAALWRGAVALPLLCMLLVAANPNVLRFGNTLRVYESPPLYLFEASP